MSPSRFAIALSRVFSTRTARRDQRRRRPHLEGLENRRLLSVSVAEYPLPIAASRPRDITAGPDGNLWFVQYNSSSVGSINPVTHAIAEYPLPSKNASPFGITTGSDGNLWITEGLTSKIAQLNITTHAITEFPAANANKIVSAPDGNLWFTVLGGGLGSFNPVTHVYSAYTPALQATAELTVGPDGNIWYTNAQKDSIGQFNITTHTETTYKVPTSYDFLGGITSGPNQNLWFVEESDDPSGDLGAVGEFDPTTHAFQQFTDTGLNNFPNQITAGPNGNLWFTDLNSNSVTQLNPGTGAFTDTVVSGQGPEAITTGPDGNMWFTEQTANQVAEAILNAPAAIPTDTTLSASPNPSQPAQAVTFTALVSPTSGTSIPTGNLIFTIDGTAQPSVLLTEINGQMTASLTVSTLGVGRHNVTADYVPAGNFVASASQTLTQDVAGQVQDGPKVVLVQRYGYHRLPTTLVLTFDQAMNPSTAQNTADYHIYNAKGRRVAVRSATYNAAEHTVTLHPARRLSLHRRNKLVVSGTGVDPVTCATGYALDGANSGRPGSDFVKELTGKSLVFSHP